MQFEFPIFEHLCPSWGSITHLGCRQVYSKGALILDMEAPAKGVYYVKRGQVDTVLFTLEGPDKVLYGIGEGSLFGEACCFTTGRTGEATVWARTDCILYFFPKEVVEGVIASQHPRLLLEMVGLLGHIVRSYAIWHQDSLGLDYYERVCRLLVYYLRWKQENPLQALRSSNEVCIHADLSQNDVAKLLGVHRVTVAKAVCRLRELGILRNFTKNELHVVDFRRLCREAQLDQTPALVALAV